MFFNLHNRQCAVCFSPVFGRWSALAAHRKKSLCNVSFLRNQLENACCIPAGLKYHLPTVRGSQLHKKNHLVATPVLTILAIGRVLIEPLAHRYSPSSSSFTLFRYLINYNCLHTKPNCCCKLYLYSFSLSSVWKFARFSTGEAHLASFQVMKSFLVIS